MRYEAVVIGVSAGGLSALTTLFKTLHGDFPLPILIVQHMHADNDDYLARHLAGMNSMTIKEADEKESIRNNTVYIAPANYHLLVEEDKTLSLSTDKKVNFCRPSADVLFETAVEAYGNRLIGIVLTGANDDGARGMLRIHKTGGLTIIQDPKTAEVSSMPQAVLKYFTPDYLLSLDEIAQLLNDVDKL